MNPRSNQEEIFELQGRMRELEIKLAGFENQARLMRFIGGALIVSVIGLVVNALVGLVF